MRIHTWVLYLMAGAYVMLVSPRLHGFEVVQESFKFHAASQKEITFFIRLPLPVGQGDYRQANILPAFCLWISDPIQLVEVIKGNSTNALVNNLIAAADRDKLPVICWTRGGTWNKSVAYEDLERQEEKLSDREFDEIAREWKTAMGRLADKYKLPVGKMYLLGMSGGAQYAHRLALRTPESFLAVHAHIASSFDKPLPKAASVKWLITAGPEHGTANRLRSSGLCRR